MSKKQWKRRRWAQKRKKRHDRSMRRFGHSLSAFLDTPGLGWFTLGRDGSKIGPFHAVAP